ncbi:MAG: hypothetical protein K8R92_11385 [Planctomycetes bacterium]|nr:hypothetical protein [Planctomycetota bacterium]
MSVVPSIRFKVGVTLLTLLAGLQLAGDPQDKKAPPNSLPAADGSANPKWLEKLDAPERTYLNEGLGKPATAPPASVEWFGGKAPEAFENSVTVIQSIQDKGGGMGPAERIRKVLPPEANFIGVVIPEDAAKLKKKLEKKTPFLIALDPDGLWTTRLGLLKIPSNMIVDKNGVIRFAGLNPNGVKLACAFLLAEKVAVVERGADATPSYPKFTDPVAGASDRRGQRMIPFAVQEWITKQPVMENKLMVIEFWATADEPSLAAVPRMNAIAKKYAADAICIGITDEYKNTFEAGLTKKKLTLASFEYALAIDTARTLSSYFDVKSMPNCAVVSSDGIVRWQGPPAQLDDAIMAKLVDAHKALTAPAQK